jgi:hypothetical protein
MWVYNGLGSKKKMDVEIFVKQTGLTELLITLRSLICVSTM